MERYENLANAIVYQAVKDYRQILKVCIQYPDDEELQQEKESIEQFFESKWCSILTELDGAWLMRKIKEDVEYDSKRILKSSI